MNFEFDTIGYWSEVKLDIVREYAVAYSKILSAQTHPRLKHVYIDAFAGAGVHVSRTTQEFVLGSPLNALQVQPPFHEYHFIELDQARVDVLDEIAEGQEQNVFVYLGDCNQVLLEDVFPRVQWEDYRRGLCLLDPYGLDLNWSVIQKAGWMKTIDIFLNFPVMDMNRNVLWRNPDKVQQDQTERMTNFWGDETWRNVAYSTEGSLFGFEEKTDNETIAEAFRQRLLQVAGFKHVPKPMPMRNSQGAIVYYLFFASQKPVASDIVKEIFKKYKNRMS